MDTVGYYKAINMGKFREAHSNHAVVLVSKDDGTDLNVEVCGILTCQSEKAFTLIGEYHTT